MKTKKNSSWINRKNLLYIVFFLFVILIIIYQLLFTPISKGSSSLSEPTVVYTGKFKPFIITIPKDWSVGELPHGNHGDMDVIAIVKPLGKELPFITISYKEIFGGNLGNVVEWGKERAQRCNNYFPRNLSDYKISGLDGVAFEYSCVKKVGIFAIETQVKCMDYYVIRENNAYNLNICAEPGYWVENGQIFDQIVSSFKIK